MNLNWENWCRLCGSYGVTTKLESTLNIENHFKISDTSAKICEKCNSYLSEFHEFIEKSKTVKKLFEKLARENHNDQKTINQLRMKYNLEPLPLIFAEPNLSSRLLKTEPFEEEYQNNEDATESRFTHSVKEEEKDINQDLHRTTKFKGNSIPTFCHICNIEFPSWSKLDVHCRTEHQIGPEVPCWGCGDIIKNFATYANHRKRCCRLLEEIYFCDLCSKKYFKKSTLEAHMKLRHAYNSKRFICSTCGKEYMNSSKLKEHARSHLPDELKLIIPCSDCDLRFSTKHKLRVHFRRIHLNCEKKYICELCGSSFNSSSNLTKHLATHLETFDHQCDVCFKKFKVKTALVAHKFIHGKALFSCDTCSQKFKTKRSLKSHKVSHSDARNFTCPHCPNTYKRLKSLKGHLFMHTGEKPFTCQFCERSFVDGSNCRKHKMKVHPVEFERWEIEHGKKKNV